MARPMTPSGLRAVLIALTCLVVLGSSWVAEAEEVDDVAREHFRRGRQIEVEGDLEGALEEYAQAQELRSIFRLYRHMGRVCQGLGRYREALAYYERFIVEGGAQVEPGRREVVLETIAELRGLVATLNIVAPDSAEIFIDGLRSEESRAGAIITIDPGVHDLRIEIEGYREYRTEVILQSGETRHIEVHFAQLEAIPDEREIEEEPVESPPLETPAEENDGDLARGRRRVRRSLFWTIFGLSAAAFVGSFVLGPLALVEQRTFNDLDDPSRNDEIDAALRESGRRGEALAISTDVLLITGGALAIATFVLTFFTTFDNTESGDSR